LSTAARGKSSHAVEAEAVSTEEKQRAYLKTWLGQDMAGERYLTQLVTAATAQQQQQQQQQHQNLLRTGATKAAAAPSSSSHVSNQYFSIPTISVH